MVLYSEQAKEDLRNILWGLATWKKHPLGYEHALQYVDDIQAEVDTICTKFYHANATHPLHKKYGNKVHTYKRNSNTQWFAIYDWNTLLRIALVNLIVNNHQTT
ncbi:MAG: hypothetical protein EZS26_002555 [Candidatus Ordinivivax streblomastigis]|uniref:Type II toxin-antitoxin system RelE/ParE family toxin n=1 Tax=Candidatus Ordinivivax streblomastigis TaxID=2540710 RepID=A0A5M8NWN4_9BACT|nr:MAG: hypothetical protein EZS26_002555 [Candidatus Ordinivivax streblomastigis]